MSDYVWQSVEGQTRIACDCGECDRTIEIDDGYVQIYGDDGEELTAHLPDEYALCRRVPAAGGMDVPESVIDIIYTVLIKSRESYAPIGKATNDWDQRIDEALLWLDEALLWLNSLAPAQGQEGASNE